MTVAAVGGDSPLDLYEAAVTWHCVGCSVIPISTNGSKRPAETWKFNQAQQVHPDSWGDGRVDFWRRPPGLGVVCGKVSGNLEMTELEGRAFSEDNMIRIGERCDELGVGDAFALLLSDDFGYAETTPSGGLHLLYRIINHEVPGNTKIARRPATPAELADKPDDRIKVLAETRGEGGYVIVAPTGGTVHPSGGSWEVLAGRIGQIPQITWNVRNLVHQAIRDVLDQMPARAPEPPRNFPTHTNQTRPGDDFNNKAGWRDILEPHGWTYHSVRGGEVLWTRPGKSRKDGHSASTGYSPDGDRLYVWSSATVFDSETPYSKFAAYALLNHNGDMAAAARELGRQGYGEQRAPRLPTSGDWETADWGTQSSNVDSPQNEAPPPFRMPKPRGIYDYTFAGSVVRFLDKWHKYIRYVDEEKIWRVWNGRFWEQDRGGSQISQAFEAMTEEMFDEARAMDDDDERKKPMQAHIRKLRDSGRTSIMNLIAAKTTVSADIFDSNPRYLNLQNGVYDLVADKFLAHDPQYMLTKVAGLSYDPDAKAERSEAFLSELLPSEQMREFTLQSLAYSLTGEADRKALFILQGIPNSGKTQITELAAKLFGDYAVSVSPGTFTKRREHGPNPELHNMRGSRFVYTSETSYEIQLDEELVKRITGKDTMSTRTLYEKPQQWIPQCTVWIATNNLPRFGSDSDAMWKRVKTVRFVNEFTDDGASGHQAQPNIGRTLAVQEAAGLFNLLLGALRRYRLAGCLSEPQELKESVASHREETDPLVQWVQAVQEMKHLVAAPGQEANQGTMRKAYATWCDEHGYAPLGAQRFGNAVTAMLRCTKRRSNGETLIIGWQWRGPTWLGPANHREDWRQGELGS